MNQTANVQKFATEKEAKEHFKLQLAQYLGARHQRIVRH